MQIQVNSDNTSKIGATTVSDTEERIRERLSRFSERLTRVEVHLRDLDGSDTVTSEGLEATLEARPAGQQPLAVSHRAENVSEAVNGALSKLTSRLESSFGKADRVR
ncbi:HPF/RaiA family ribosome-associated protein [Novosphingobium sp. RD2P27]|uniref:HPF/RaiA family ribosome-associated protein n=1 Tax=Novosphingobium kalidii TaxID=3230299 RepID=A0ABV2CWI0_9SPHN